MKHVLRLLIKLYPAWWRRRYGKELEALLEDSGFRSRDVWDVFRGAIGMQISKWSFGKIVTVCGVAGVLLAGVLAFSRPYPYRSTAMLKSEGDRSPDDWKALNQAAFTPQALSSIIDRERLYAGRAAEDTMNRMRSAIQISPVAPNLVQVSFAGEDPVQAQRVSQELAGRLVAANLSSAGNPKGQVIKLEEPADPAKMQIEGKARVAMTGLGLPAGLLFGVILALILRRRAAPAS